MKLVWLVYDIPQLAKCGNPSGRLRRLGVRVNLSCWILPEDRVPYLLLNKLNDCGATTCTARFDECDTGTLLEMARKAARDQMASVAARLEKSAQNYAQRLANDTEGTPEGKLQEYQNRIAIALKRAEKTLEDLERGAASLGLSISADADTTRHRTMSVSLSAKTRASLYAQMIGMVEDDLFRESAEVDDGAMPPEVLADILEEQGEDTLAFRAAFAS